MNEWIDWWLSLTLIKEMTRKIGMQTKGMTVSRCANL